MSLFTPPPIDVPIFGALIDGFDVQQAIANMTRGANDRPRQDIVIERLEISRELINVSE